MNQRSPNSRLWGPVLSLLLALTVVSCVQMSDQAPREPEPVASEDAQIEEITVSGSRVDDNRRTTETRRQQHGSGSSGSIARFGFHLSAPPESGVLDMAQQAALANVGTDEEVWVIARPSPAADSSAEDSEAGGGSMLVYRQPDPDMPQVQVPLPLQHTAVTANVDGYVSSVNVRQSFENPYSEKIEAVYVFPLPEKSAVNEFLMIIGERRIRGILREKEEAEAIYAEARQQGYQASLLTQHRPNVFEQKVANIEPGHAIDVDIRYFHTLSYVDGWYSFVFPTVVGPRFNPPASQDPIEAKPRGTAPTGNTAVSYLRPGERSGHDISIQVQLDAGVAIEEIRSTHEIVASRPTPEKASIELASRSTIPNRDFILEFKVAGDRIRSNFLSYEDPGTGEGYFTMMLYPPASTGTLPRRPMEMVFVIDCSGSMSGRPIEQAKNAVSAALEHLQPGDTFQIIRFSEQASRLGTSPLQANARNLRTARRYLAGLSGTGGTMMVEGVKAALDFPHDPARLRFVSFMTDGYIGNEYDILAAVHERIGQSRIFSFGVGSSVNRYLLERMAKAGRGAVAYLGPQDSGSDIMSAFFGRISQPALTDLQIDWGRMGVSDVYPAQIPDLFVGRPVLITGRYSGVLSPITVTGLAANETRQFVVSADAADPPNPNLAKIWARLRIADLSDRQIWESDPHRELESAITTTALEHQLVSSYTAFVAVDASRRTAGDHGTTVEQAVPVPDGVRYETTVRQ